MPSYETPDGVLLIYTGGTIGSIVKDSKDPLSALVPGDMDDILKYFPSYDARDKKIAIGNTLVRLGTHSWEEPLDSSNIVAKDWFEMCEVVKKNYDDYEGFVILHGTDTLAYTSSALAFMLDSLDRPVVITGSQIPIGRTRSDAVQNVVSAIEVAAARSLGGVVVPEVMVLFQDDLQRGCRIRKATASSFAGFASPNFPPLGTIGEHIVIRKELIREPGTNVNVPNPDEAPNESVLLLDIFPGMKPVVLERLLNLGRGKDDKPEDRLEGVVMKTFGTGNMPSAPKFLAPLKTAMELPENERLMIVNVTQCMQGEVEQGLYDVSSALLSYGVISGLDMTPEAALTKLMYVLGMRGRLSRRQMEDLLQLNLRGEQRADVYNVYFKPGKNVDQNLLAYEKPAVFEQDELIFTGSEFGGRPYDSNRLETAYLRVIGLRTADRKRGRIEFRAFLGDPNANKDTSEDSKYYLGTVDKRFTADDADEGLNAVIDVTQCAQGLVDGMKKTSLVLFPLSDDFALTSVSIALYTS